MTNVRIVKVTKIELGAATGATSETLSNVKRVVWGKVPTRHTPLTVMATVVPVGWNRPHKYVILEFHCLGEIYHAVYHNGTGNVAYDSFTADNPALPYCKIFLADENSAEWTVTLTGAIIDGVNEGMNDGEDMVSIIYVSAYSMGPMVKS